MRLVLFVLLILCTGCMSHPLETEENVSVEISFCPQEDCLSAFLNLTTSVTSLDCALFDLNHPVMIEHLDRIDARVVVDGDNDDGLEELNVRFDDKNQYMHNKFCVVNSSTVWTGSMNPTINGFEKNDNNAVTISSKLIASAYSEEFDELWRGIYGSGSSGSINSGNVSVLFCPEDNCKEKVISILDSAKESIHFMTFSFTDRDIADVLISKHSAGVSVQGIMEKRRLNMKYNVYKYLREADVNAVGDVNSAIMHHKVFIVDEETVITGSYNPTKSGNSRNDENLVVIKDSEIADQYIQTFVYLSQLEKNDP